jgi:hypothetical protein
MKIQKCKYGNKDWKKYVKPVWQNRGVWRKGDPKIYRWLNFLIIKSSNK